MPTLTLSEADIADALAGRYGPVRISYRYEWRTLAFDFVADMTAAIEQASITLDNNRAVVRTADLSVRAELLPAGFDDSSDHVAIFADLDVQGQTVSYALGLYLMDRIIERHSPNGNEVWGVQASDVGIHLYENTFTLPYIIPAGSNYVEEAERVIQLAGLRTGIAPLTRTTPVVFVWPPGTAYGTIANDLMEGINYFPVWADRTGQIVSRERIDPSEETSVVSYTTEESPRMLRSEFTRARDRGRYLNEVTMFVGTPSRPPVTVKVTNNDEDSPISTVNKGAVTSQRINSDRVWDLNTMISIGVWRVQDASVRAQVGTAVTHPDPRRDAHETYTLTIESTEVASKWRCEGWKMTLATGSALNHRVGYAAHVDAEVEICG